MRYYAPGQHFGDLSVLDRRPVALPPLLGTLATRVVRFNEAFELGSDPTFLTVDLRLSALGLATNLLFRPPQVVLRLQYADGRQAVYRLVPEIALMGFLASPQVATADDFVKLALGETSAFGPSARPTAASIEAGRGGSLVYRREITVTLRNVDVRLLTQGEHERPDANQIHQQPQP